ALAVGLLGQWMLHRADKPQLAGLDGRIEIRHFRPSSLRFFWLLARPRATTATGCCQHEQGKHRTDPGKTHKFLSVGTDDHFFMEILPGTSLPSCSPANTREEVTSTAWMALSFWPFKPVWRVNVKELSLN